MTANTPQVDVYKIAKAFEKISKGFKGKNLEELNIITEQEFSKLVPSENSEVYIASGYTPDDNRLSISVYVTNPKKNPTKEELRFEKFMFELLIRADISKLPTLVKCLDMMQLKESDSYFIDGIPAFFDKSINEYYIHFIIVKE